MNGFLLADLHADDGLFKTFDDVAFANDKIQRAAIGTGVKDFTGIKLAGVV